MKEQQPLSRLSLKVAPGLLPLFTTILQSGIEIRSESGTSLGRFLNSLPGFSADYLAEVVQTIFLNGTAIDDLTTPLTGDRAVLALSAAMPGLAGAIFRKNSFHAALRTVTGAKTRDASQGAVIVTLKLFNSIARERGEDLLRQGVCLKARILADFLERRPELRQGIRAVRLDGQNLEPADLSRILAERPCIHLFIENADD
jgi:hypothetical protein